MNILVYLNNLTLTEWIVFALLSNILLYVFSISIYIFIDKTCTKNKIQAKDMTLTFADFYQSQLTLCINAFVMLIGVFCMKMGYIKLYLHTVFIDYVIELVALLLIMDFLMFIFHYLAHQPFIYKLVHYKHHKHISTNFFSLFVLHPIEALGFGLLMLGVLFCYNFSLISVFCYIIINVIWGTIGHLNREFFPKWVNRFYIGTSRFHHDHHINEAYNFGFYTSIWDHLFNTYKSTKN